MLSKISPFSYFFEIFTYYNNFLTYIKDLLFIFYKLISLFLKNEHFLKTLILFKSLIY